jgi:hypothetical protein
VGTDWTMMMMMMMMIKVIFEQQQQQQQHSERCEGFIVAFKNIHSY